MARKKKVEEAPVTTTLTDQDIALGVTNDPALSQDEFELCGKKYKFVHLSYDYYIEFMFKIKPLLAAVVGTVSSKAKVTMSLPGIELLPSEAAGMSGIVQFCASDIPDMVRIIANNSVEFDGRPEDRVTVETIKKARGITPMSLAKIVMGQVRFNNMIGEFGSFFVDCLPLLKAMGILLPPAAKAQPPLSAALTTKTTP